MAPPPIPLNYPCSKIVMEHMRANHRYLLAACCPDLRIIHTKAPLKINELILDTHGFNVDLVEHSLHTFVSNLDQIPRDWRVNVPPHGLRYDIDRFGHRYEADAIEGDIAISQWLVDYRAHDIRIPEDEWTPAPSDVHRERMRRAMRQREKTRVRRARGRVRVQTYFHYTRYTPIQYPRGEWGLFRNNNFLLFRLQTQVRYPRGIQMAEALRKLMGNFLAPREIFVNRLDIACSFGILRLPRDLRFHVVSLKTERNSAQVLNTISPFIIGDPLQKLAVTVLRDEDPIFNHEILRTIPCLSLCLAFQIEFDWVDRLTRIDVASLEIDNSYYSDDTITLVGTHWIEHPRPVGRKISFEETNQIEDQFERVQTELGTTMGTIPHRNFPPEHPNCGFTQVNTGAVLVIYVHKEVQNEVRPKWFLVLEMMEARHVRALEEGEA